ncbi:hypothetical protein Lal_00024328, partial [Lupinus albus]
ISYASRVLDVAFGGQEAPKQRSADAGFFSQHHDFRECSVSMHQDESQAGQECSVSMHQDESQAGQLCSVNIHQLISQAHQTLRQYSVKVKSDQDSLGQTVLGLGHQGGTLGIRGALDGCFDRIYLWKSTLRVKAPTKGRTSFTIMIQVVSNFFENEKKVYDQYRLYAINSISYS